MSTWVCLSQEMKGPHQSSVYYFRYWLGLRKQHVIDTEPHEFNDSETFLVNWFNKTSGRLLHTIQKLAIHFHVKCWETTAKIAKYKANKNLKSVWSEKGNNLCYLFF